MAFEDAFTDLFHSPKVMKLLWAMESGLRDNTAGSDRLSDLVTHLSFWIFREHFSYLQLSEEQRIRRLRFTNELVVELCHLLQPNVQPQIRATTALSVAVKVTFALNFFDSESFQSATGDITNIVQFTVHHCIQEFTEALYSRRRDYISFQIAGEMQDERACGFAWIAGFPMVQGTIDCMTWLFRHCITILRSSITAKAMTHLMCHWCVTTHSESSMSILAILVAAMMPSSCARPVCQNSSSQLLSTWLTTPLHNPNTPAQHSYNESHAASRNIIEQTIGLLKQRFCCLDCSGGALQYSAERLSHFMVGCSMLHNLTITRAQPLPPGIAGTPEEEEEDGEEEEDQVDSEEDEEQEFGRR
uniref:putative nuclease HARBI1 n=1 Tax=Pristiophorus japonicus TaxID=55135 RepID=UPI00398F5E31